MSEANNTGLWLQPPSLSVAPSSPGPADQIRMIFGTDSEPESVEESQQQQLQQAAVATLQQQHSPQPQPLWH